ncbi:oligosaccharide repeat unit polymerase [Caenimonas sedimenti]|uniref:Oligosaccharide repeat unit polymerase n=1 Tax=Caenimonas sedimenti TaxID=2596921 RepID=A0A562ZFV3_9BURK|nr:O-antigen polymerase [Caenimonas sedimenti]TWO66147.1 oligosaccharide repeat unit polymerase [Caenimonas sedimenti]
MTSPAAPPAAGAAATPEGPAPDALASLRRWAWGIAALTAAFALALAGLQDHPLRLTLYVCAFAVIAFCYFAYTHADHGFDVLHPSIGLFLLLFLYSLSSALFVETEGTTFFGERLLPDVHPIYYWTCIAGAAGLALGLALRRLCGVRSSPMVAVAAGDNARLRQTMVWCALALCLVFLPFIAPKFNFVTVRSYYETALSSRVERLADDAVGTMDVLTLYLPLTLLLATCAYAMQCKQVRPAWRLLALAAFAAYVTTGFLAGERYTILYCGLVMLAYRHFRVAPITLTQALVAGGAAYLLMNLVPIVRGSTDPARMLQALQDNFDLRGWADFSLTYSNELLTATNLHRHIQGMLLGETGYNWGYSLVTDLLVWIPRILYPDRPLPTSEMFVEVFYPGVRDIGGGYGFFILQEGYWAFGIFGAFAFMALFGWIVDGIYRLIYRWQGYDLVLFLYAAVYADIVMASIRSGVVGSFKAGLLHAVPFGFVLLVHALRKRLRKDGP